jgi:transposase-like protein
MGRQRFTPEFKDEAVRQVTERGHSVVGRLFRRKARKWPKTWRRGGMALAYRRDDCECAASSRFQT